MNLDTLIFTLFLINNRIANGLNNLSGSPKLTNLNLSGNKVKDLEELTALAEFKNLTVLDLFNNELTTSTENYREKIFSLIPSLVYLDGYDAQDVECVSEGEDEDELNGNSDEEGVDGEGKRIENTLPRAWVGRREFIVNLATANSVRWRIIVLWGVLCCHSPLQIMPIDQTIEF